MENRDWIGLPVSKYNDLLLTGISEESFCREMAIQVYILSSSNGLIVHLMELLVPWKQKVQISQFIFSPHILQSTSQYFPTCDLVCVYVSFLAGEEEGRT